MLITDQMFRIKWKFRERENIRIYWSNVFVMWNVQLILIVIKVEVFFAFALNRLKLISIGSCREKVADFKNCHNGLNYDLFEMLLQRKPSLKLHRCVCVCVCVCLCVCVWERERERERDRKKERERDRERKIKRQKMTVIYEWILNFACFIFNIMVITL